MDVMGASRERIGTSGSARRARRRVGGKPSGAVARPGWGPGPSQSRRVGWPDLAQVGFFAEPAWATPAYRSHRRADAAPLARRHGTFPQAALAQPAPLQHRGGLHGAPPAAGGGRLLLQRLVGLEEVLDLRQP